MSSQAGEVAQTLKRAVTAHQSGRREEAARLYRECLASDPECLPALYYGGLLALQQGQFADAATFLQTLAKLDPGKAEVWYHLALAQQQCGQADDAEHSYRQALARNPAMAPAANNLAALLRGRGARDAAIGFSRQAVQIDPARTEYWLNLGLALHERGDVGAALDCYRRAERCDSEAYEVLVNLGCALSDLGDPVGAVAYLKRAAAASPEHAAKTYINLGAVHDEAEDWDSAASAYRSALEIERDNVQALMNLGRTELERGDADASRHCYGEVLDRGANPGAQIRLATLLPPIPESTEQITDLRRSFLAGVRRLHSQQIRLADPLQEVGETPFAISYHGREDDREILGALASLYLDACPALGFVAPCRRSPKATGRRIRIGFISHFFFEHSIAKSMQGIISGLPRDRFEKHVIRIPPFRMDARAKEIDAAAEVVHRLPANLFAAQEQLAALDLDVLFYTDLGMEPLAYFLSFARLAPVQCATWGHPTTSGVPAVDYYLSHADLEPEGSERFYSEQLVRIRSGAVYPGYARPASLPVSRSRRELGLPEQGPLYICPQSAFKLMPEFDPVLAAILRGQPTATLLVPEGRHSQLTAQLRRRWATALPDALDRVQFFAHRSLPEFCNLIAAADVVLDPHPVGGGITTFDALHAGTPVVTLPGPLMRSRFASACYLRLGMAEWIASDTDDYVQKALQLGSDGDLRENLRQRIGIGSQALIYGDLSGLPEYTAFLEQAVARAVNERP